jgi:hypothetical protein
MSELKEDTKVEKKSPMQVEEEELNKLSKQHNELNVELVKLRNEVATKTAQALEILQQYTVRRENHLSRIIEAQSQQLKEKKLAD